MSAEATGAALWAVRMLLLWAGGYLSARGVGNEDMWNGVVDQIAGPLVMLCAAAWSYRARQRQLAAVPPEQNP